MPGSVIGAVGSIIGGNEQAEATETAANISAGATAAQTALQRQMYEEGVSRQAPWLEAGKNALSQMTTGTQPGGEYLRPFSMADYQADPGSTFRIKEGLRGIEQSAAAKGGYLSGNALKAITAYGQEMGSQEYQNAYNRYRQEKEAAYNRLAGIAGTGQTTAAGMGQAGSQYATQAGQYGMTGAANQANAALMGGQTRASMYQGIGNAIGSGVQNVSQGWNDLNSPYGQFNAWMQG